MRAPSVASVFNDAYVAEQLEAYRRDPASVDESWRQFFRLAEQIGGGSGGASEYVASLRVAAGAAALVAAIRQYGHLGVRLDPLGSEPPGAAELTPEFHGITPADLTKVPASALGFDGNGTAADVVSTLRELYSSTIGFEFEHLGADAERA